MNGHTATRVITNSIDSDDADYVMRVLTTMTLWLTTTMVAALVVAACSSTRVGSEHCC